MRRRVVGLAHIDDDPHATADAEQLDDRLHQLDARICDAEVAVGRGRHRTPRPRLLPALRTLTGELATGLQQLRHEKTRLETMLVTVAADPGRRARLHHVAASTRGQLATMTAHERHSVCDLLDVSVTVQQWEHCPRCQGRRRVSGNGNANGCPVCHGAGQVPELRISGLWIELQERY